MNRFALLAALLISSVTGSALADCDYESHKAGTHGGVVPAWSYNHSFRSEEPMADQCSREAEDIDCEAEGLYGLECAEKMQRIYASCVAEETCLLAVDGWMEDDQVPLAGLEAMYGACLDLVTAAGGSGR